MDGLEFLPINTATMTPRMSFQRLDFHLELSS